MFEMGIVLLVLINTVLFYSYGLALPYYYYYSALWLILPVNPLVKADANFNHYAQRMPQELNLFMYNH